MPHAEEEHCALNPEQPILTAMVTSANHCDIRLPTLTWRHLPHYHITKLISHPVLGDRECLLFRLTTIPEDFLCWNCKFITTQVQQILSKNINILFLCAVILATFFHSMASANWLFWSQHQHSLFMELDRTWTYRLAAYNPGKCYYILAPCRLYWLLRIYVSNNIIQHIT